MLYLSFTWTILETVWRKLWVIRFREGSRETSQKRKKCMKNSSSHLKKNTYQLTKYQNYSSCLHRTLASIEWLHDESSTTDSTVWHDAMEWEAFRSPQWFPDKSQIFLKLYGFWFPRDNTLRHKGNVTGSINSAEKNSEKYGYSTIYWHYGSLQVDVF